jgi:hypothetical protein
LICRRSNQVLDADQQGIIKNACSTITEYVSQTFKTGAMADQLEA